MAIVTPLSGDRTLSLDDHRSKRTGVEPITEEKEEGA
jgi:hypothetical protein